MATVALAEYDAEARFRARAARGSRKEGLRLLDELDRKVKSGDERGSGGQLVESRLD